MERVRGRSVFMGKGAKVSRPSAVFAHARRPIVDLLVASAGLELWRRAATVTRAKAVSLTGLFKAETATMAQRQHRTARRKLT
jgi:hypothetical protein